MSPEPFPHSQHHPSSCRDGGRPIHAKPRENYSPYLGPSSPQRRKANQPSRPLPSSPPHPRQRRGPAGFLPRPILGGPPPHRCGDQLCCRHHRMPCPRQIRRQILCLVHAPVHHRSFPFHHTISNTGLEQALPLASLTRASRRPWWRTHHLSLASGPIDHHHRSRPRRHSLYDTPFIFCQTSTNQSQEVVAPRYTSPDMLVLFISASRTLS